MILGIHYLTYVVRTTLRSMPQILQQLKIQVHRHQAPSHSSWRVSRYLNYCLACLCLSSYGQRCRRWSQPRTFLCRFPSTIRGTQIWHTYLPVGPTLNSSWEFHNRWCWLRGIQDSIGPGWRERGLSLRRMHRQWGSSPLCLVFSRKKRRKNSAG